MLRLPHTFVTPSFLRLLVSMCKRLRTLVITGNRTLEGGAFDICHPNLRSIEFHGIIPPILTINCRALTHIDTLGEPAFMAPLAMFPHLRSPSLICPSLKSLRLSRIHCAKGVLKALAAHAKTITSLEAYKTGESPVIALTHFKFAFSKFVIMRWWVQYVPMLSPRGRYLRGSNWKAKTLRRPSW